MVSSTSLINSFVLHTTKHTPDCSLHLLGYIGWKERQRPLVLLRLKNINKYFDLPDIFIIEMKELAGSSRFIFWRPTEPGSRQLRYRSQISRCGIKNRARHHKPEQFRMAAEFGSFQNRKQKFLMRMFLKIFRRESLS